MKDFITKLSRTLGSSRALSFIGHISRYHPGSFHHHFDHDDHYPYISKYPG